MAGRRVLYLAVLQGCLIFYIAYREWASWLMLAAVLALPWFSLVLSLPAMLLTKLTLLCPKTADMDTAIPTRLTAHCPLPVPPVRYHLHTAHSLTGETHRFKADASLPTAHCGALTIAPVRVWVYDYLGLLRLPRKVAAQTVTVLPRSVEFPLPATLKRHAGSTLRPKPGGGFAEHHDLRLYRPGDSLHSIHWKLTAKTGKLIVREPLVAQPGQLLLTMCLQGQPEVLDQKFGKLLFLSRFLLSKDQTHALHCLTGQGLLCFSIQNETDLLAALTALLGASPAEADTLPETGGGIWHYHIGGEPDET